MKPTNYLKTENKRKQLSWYGRPAMRSNQPLEGYNAFANGIMKEQGGGRKTFEQWLESCRHIEHDTGVRLEALKQSNFTEYNKKSKTCRDRDAIMTNLVLKHKSGELSTDEYFDEVVKANGDYDLPSALQP